MKTLSRFVAKFTSLIVAVLSCLDRVIFMVANSDKNSARSDKGRGPTRRTVYHDGRRPRNWSGCRLGE
jgi:hypothetical protein